MTQTTHPTPASVRSWMQQRQADRTPPPSPERIRELLGWQLIEDERKQLARLG